MRHLPIAIESTVRTDGLGLAVPSLDETGPEFLEEIKAYLDCRSRGVVPRAVAGRGVGGILQLLCPADPSVPQAVDAVGGGPERLPPGGLARSRRPPGPVWA